MTRDYSKPESRAAAQRGAKAVSGRARKKAAVGGRGLRTGVARNEVRRQAAEEVLRLSEEEYSALFKMAPVGIAISTVKGKVLTFNDQMCALAGMSLKEALATRASAYYLRPVDRRKSLAEIRRTGKVENREIRFRRKDGATFVGLVRMQRITLGGRPALLSVVQDITRQKEAEHHLQGVSGLLRLFTTHTSRDEYFSAVVDLLRNWCGCHCAGIRLVDAEGHLPYAAQAGFSRPFLEQECSMSLTTGSCSCLRVIRGEARPGDAENSTSSGSFFCNHTALEVVAPGEPRHCVKTACIKAGYQSLAHVPIRYGHKLLGTIHLADRAPHRFAAGTVTFLEAVSPLIGEALHRFGIEDSLQESEERFRSMFQRHQATMLLIDPVTGAIVDANPAAAAFYGYDCDRLRQMRVEEINTMPPEVLSGYRRQALQHDRNVFVFPHRLADGQIRTVEVHSSPVMVRGQPLLFSVIHDITDRKLLEKAVLDIGERERQAVGQDLHDSLGGKLAGAALLSKVLAQTLAGQSSSEAALAEEVVQCINESIAQTRMIARGLYPAELAVAGLAGGLAELATETEKRFGVSCRFLQAGDVVVQEPFLALHLFRIAQEGVRNAVRHGGARQVTLRLCDRGAGVELEICDDGAGIAEHREGTAGLGLRTMSYRANAIGAHLTITPGPAGGTVLSCVVPAARDFQPQSR